jgi:hypothetical protein
MPGNSTPVDILCNCDNCRDPITYTSPVPGLINPTNLLLSCDVAIQQTELVIFASEPKQCPNQLEVRVKGY